VSMVESSCSIYMLLDHHDSQKPLLIVQALTATQL